MIYFVQRANSDIKIGFTDDWQSRRLTLQHKQGRIALLGWIEGGVAKEKELHKQFRDYRINKKHRSDWFEVNQGLLDFIQAETIKETPARTWTLMTLSDDVFSWINFIREWKAAQGLPKPTISDVIRECLLAKYPRIEEAYAEYAKVEEESKAVLRDLDAA
jgi:hypothetical protein